MDHETTLNLLRGCWLFFSHARMTLLPAGHLANAAYRIGFQLAVTGAWVA
jgi:hypothetical protein